MTFISTNTYLNLADMTINAHYIYNSLTLSGWTLNAVAGVLGNMQTESTINPGIWQGRNYGNMSGGYGLVQWTPATKYIDWADQRGLEWGHMDSQLDRIQYEIDHGLQWYHPTMSFYDFTQSELSPYELALLFVKHYERPANPYQVKRGLQAQAWYTVLSGLEPPSYKPDYGDFFIVDRHQTVMRRRPR